MKKLGTLCALFTLAMAMVATADETKKDSAAPVTDPMAGMEMGAPKEMKTLDFLIGTWDCAMSMRNPSCDTCPRIPSTGVQIFSMTADGSAQLTTYNGQFMGMPFAGTGLTCYNRETKKFENVWIDNTSARFSKVEGNWEGEKFVLGGPDHMGPLNWITRQTTSKTSETTFDWTYESSYDNGATYSTEVKISYTKRK